MKIDINKEEWEFLRCFLSRAILLEGKSIPMHGFDVATDLVKAQNIVEKLGSKFVSGKISLPKMSEVSPIPWDDLKKSLSDSIDNAIENYKKEKR